YTLESERLLPPAASGNRASHQARSHHRGTLAAHRSPRLVGRNDSAGLSLSLDRGTVFPVVQVYPGLSPPTFPKCQWRGDPVLRSLDRQPARGVVDRPQADQTNVGNDPVLPDRLGNSGGIGVASLEGSDKVIA